MGIQIYYDGDCPFCNSYTSLLRLRQNLGSVELISLRDNPEACEEFNSKGLDVDAGMIVRTPDGDLHGDLALQFLAAQSTDQTPISRLNHKIFSSKSVSGSIYPVLRSARNAVLFLLGRDRIQKQPPSRLQELFSVALGCFLVLHFVVYATQFRAPIFGTTIVILLLGFLFLKFPNEKRLFLIAVPVLFWDAILQMPTFSNHTILKNAFLLGILLAGIRVWFRGQSWDCFQREFMGIGRQLLLIMYFFGVFHKLNSDYFNLDVSCAVALWQEMPWPLRLIDSPIFYNLAIYGSLIVEAVIALCLVSRWSRHYGIVIGVGFHMMLGLSGYALYPPFSTLTIVLHLCFVDENLASRISTSKLLKPVLNFAKRPIGMFVILLAVLSLGISAWVGSYAYFGVVWFVMLVPFWFVFFYETTRSRISDPMSLLIRPRWLNIVGLAFFLNCFSPYLGLKTAQTMSMFANLSLEGGRSNHLLLRQAPGPFDYLGDVVTITEPGGIPYLSYASREGLQITYYTLLNYIDLNRDARVSFSRRGVAHKKEGYESLKADIDSQLDPVWFRKYFHFTPADLSVPKSCALDR